MEMRKFDHLMIGNSTAAVGAIDAIRSIDGSASIAVVSPETEHTYSRPLITYFMSGKVAENNVYYRPADFYERMSVTCIFGEQMRSVSTEERCVTLASGEHIGYGSLLLAAGGAPIAPPIPGIGRPGVFFMNSIDVARSARGWRARSGRAVVIGGGLGGLSIALRLAVRGWRVTVWEQGPSFGGKMNRWTAAGFRFDTGPSLITMPWVFEELFAFAGVRMQDYLETAALAPVARYVYPDGTTFHYSTSMPELLPVIRGLEGNDRGFFEFMRLGARIYALSKDTFLRRPIGAPPDRKALGALRHAPVLRGWGNYQQTVNAYFRSAELRQLYGRYPTYVGSSPYRSPATLAIIPFIELVFGGWYIRGGLYRLVEALCGLLEARGVALRAAPARRASAPAPAKSAPVRPIQPR